MHIKTIDFHSFMISMIIKTTHIICYLLCALFNFKSCGFYLAFAISRSLSLLHYFLQFFLFYPICKLHVVSLSNIQNTPNWIHIKEPFIVHILLLYPRANSFYGINSESLFILEYSRKKLGKFHFGSIHFGIVLF